MIKDLVCSECGGAEFELRKNAADAIKIRCAKCDIAVAYGWNTKILYLDSKPRGAVSNE